jgi:NAD(P)H-hydrate epimerase
MFKVDKNLLKEIYQKRRDESKKYDFGLLLVIGGSEFYTGSPALSALAAYRAGVDMVHIIAPKRAADIIASFSPDIASYPLQGERLNKDNVSVLDSMVKSAQNSSHNKTAVVIGGGLGRSEETKEAVLEFLSNLDSPCVIDADAIHALSKKPEVVQGKKCIITPHLYEFFILRGKNVSVVGLQEKIKEVKLAAEELNSVVVLKGRYDIIAGPGEDEIAVDRSGSPAMTVGGTGDTLAGIAGALLARGIEPFKAACAASYINGRAGERAAKKLGQSMLATDLIEEISDVLPKAV